MVWGPICVYCCIHSHHQSVAGQHLTAVCLFKLVPWRAAVSAGCWWPSLKPRSSEPANPTVRPCEERTLSPCAFPNQFSFYCSSCSKNTRIWSVLHLQERVIRTVSWRWALSATPPDRSATLWTQSGTSTASSSSKTSTRTCCVSLCLRKTSSHQMVSGWEPHTDALTFIRLFVLFVLPLQHDGNTRNHCFWLVLTFFFKAIDVPISTNALCLLLSLFPVFSLCFVTVNVLAALRHALPVKWGDLVQKTKIYQPLLASHINTYYSSL